MVLRMSRYPERYSVLDLLPAPAWLRSIGRRRGSSRSCGIIGRRANVVE